MAWIELHQEVKNHPKITRLAVELGVGKAEARGYVTGLWIQCSLYSRNGDVTEWTDIEFADACDAPDGKRVKDALIKHRFLDVVEDRLLVHDWDEGGMKLLISKQERQKRYLDKRRHGDVTVTPQETPQGQTKDGIPNLPYLTNQPTNLPTAKSGGEGGKETKATAGEAERSKWFEEIWSKYPEKSGKKNALRHYLATVKTDADRDNCTRGLENYLRSKNPKKGFIKNGATWFNEWQDWTTPTPVMMGGQFSPPPTGKPKVALPTILQTVCEECEVNGVRTIITGGELCPVCYPKCEKCGNNHYKTMKCIDVVDAQQFVLKAVERATASAQRVRHE